MSTDTKNLSVREFEMEKDLDTIASWWADHERPVNLGAMLPEHGYIIDDVCAAWVLLPLNGKIAWICWMVGNPKTSPRLVHAGMQEVVGAAVELARMCGATHAIANLGHTGLVKNFERLGFKAEPEQNTTVWGKL